MKQARILLADDHYLILEGIRGLLARQYDVVGVTNNGKALVEAALRLVPDLVVLDVAMPILNGIDAAREIKKALPDTKVLFLSMHSSAIYLRRALEAGGDGYVLKSGAAEELMTAIDAALAGNTYLSPGFDASVIDNLRMRPADSTRPAMDLTARQRQILQLIAEGRQNKEIAHILHVSVKTVEFHRSRLMSKLGARTIAELTRIAMAEGLVAAPE